MLTCVGERDDVEAGLVLRHLHEERVERAHGAEVRDEARQSQPRVVVPPQRFVGQLQVAQDAVADSLLDSLPLVASQRFVQFRRRVRVRSCSWKSNQVSSTQTERVIRWTQTSPPHKSAGLYDSHR